MRKILFIALLLLSNFAFADRPESGWWWNPERSGSGFNIEVQNDTVFVATFVYDEAGNPVWYSGSGILANSIVRLTLMRSDGGSCIDCRYDGPPASSSVRQVILQFTSPWEGVVNWGGRDMEEIKRFNFGFGFWPNSMLGEWILVTKNPDGTGSYEADRVTFNKTTGSVSASGSVTQVNYKKAAIGELEFTLQPYCCYIKIDYPNGLSDFYALSIAGYNKFTGVKSIINTNADNNSIKRTLENFSEPAEAYRVQ